MNGSRNEGKLADDDIFPGRATKAKKRKCDNNGKQWQKMSERLLPLRRGSRDLLTGCCCCSIQFPLSFDALVVVRWRSEWRILCRRRWSIVDGSAESASVPALCDVCQIFWFLGVKEGSALLVIHLSDKRVSKGVWNFCAGGLSTCVRRLGGLACGFFFFPEKNAVFTCKFMLIRAKTEASVRHARDWPLRCHVTRLNQSGTIPLVCSGQVRPSPTGRTCCNIE